MNRPDGTLGQRASAWNEANALTVLRIALVPLLGWLMLSDDGRDPRLRYAAAAVFAVAMLTDRVDGELARRRHLITPFGQIADPIADKAMMTMAFSGLSILGVIPWWITIVMVVRDWGVTLVRFLVLRNGVLPASRGGKVKTALQSLAAFVFLLPLWEIPGAAIWTGLAWVVLVAALIVTVVTGVDYLGRAWRLRRPDSTSHD